VDLDRPHTLSELAGVAADVVQQRLRGLGGDVAFPVSVQGDGDTQVASLCAVDQAVSGSLVFVASKDYLARAEGSAAAAVIAPPNLEPGAKPALIAPEPRLAFTALMEYAAPKARPAAAAEGQVFYQDRASAAVGPGTVIGPGCFIGANASIGANCRVHPGVHIDEGVVIGDDCLIHPKVALLRNVRLGRGVILHPGVVIGGDGFSYDQLPDPDGGRLYHLKNAHFGGVVIGDFVEVGANSTIDRGLIGDTVVGEGTKIDNMVHIAHNVRIGRDCIILALVGVSGSVSIGDRAFLLGQSGLVAGVSVGDDAIVIGQSGVSKNLPAGRTAWAGSPAQPLDAEWKQKAMIKRELPRLPKLWNALKKAETFDQFKALLFQK
jgi:UDP-3-O-[3-hydroxymyristoyl] glucosamine N-acyltransferase